MRTKLRKRTVIGALWGLVLCLGHAAAQSSGQTSASTGALDVAVTYAGAHAIYTTGGPFWLNGGGLDLNARFFHGVGLAASITGLEKGSSTPGVASLNILTIAFGPSYTFHPGHRISVRGEGLLGEADGFRSLFAYGSGPTPSLTAGTTDSSNSLALQAGGNVDLKLTNHLGLRLAKVDYLRTQFPNGTTHVQNNIRVAAGVVFSFGH